MLALPKHFCTVEKRDHETKIWRKCTNGGKELCAESQRFAFTSVTIEMRTAYMKTGIFHKQQNTTRNGSSK